MGKIRGMLKGFPRGFSPMAIIYTVVVIQLDSVKLLDIDIVFPKFTPGFFFHEKSVLRLVFLRWRIVEATRSAASFALALTSRAVFITSSGSGAISGLKYCGLVANCLKS
jgi:hypothetical protein